MSQLNSVIARNISYLIIGMLVFLVIVVAQNVFAADDMDPRVEAAINERIAPVGKVRTGKIAAASAGAGKVDAKGTYQSACFACHGTGAAGAPKLGDKGAWKARIGQGKAKLYSNAVKGFKGMPPKGGRSDLSDAVVKAVVDYMVSQSK
ncbi:MAG: c-type cytochrome [Gammaproteobacteria bacterium]|nr:c-type cytochrome [Gammaproteobacteria bacterium]